MSDDLQAMLVELEHLEADVTERFAVSNPARLRQFTAHLGTVRMALEALFTEVPYDHFAGNSANVS